MKGSATNEGTTVTLDVVIAGKNMKGTINLGVVKLDIVQVDGAAYVKAGDDFWKTFLPAQQQATLLPMVSNKYVKIPAASAKSFDFSAKEILKPEGTVTKGEPTTINGTSAITLLDGDKGKLFVATTGEPYPLQMVSDGNTIDFTEVGAAVTITAPSAAEVFDLSAFTG